jgi:predicted ArsR family transcriptional regulator
MRRGRGGASRCTLRYLMGLGWSTEGTSTNSTRRAVLFALRRDGPLTPDRLSGLVGISRTAILQQLRALTTAGLVQRSIVKHGVGRPRHLYELTADAQAAFPSNYGGLAASMIRALDGLGGTDLLDEVFRVRRGQLASQIQRRFAEKGLHTASLEERARELARFQDEQGYLCDCRRERRVQTNGPADRVSGEHGEADGPGPIHVDDDGVIRLRERNCAIYEVATMTPAACRAEVQLFRDVLGARVVRETHIASGDRACTYRIEERPARA